MTRSVDEQLAEVLAAVGPLAELELSLLDAHGCVLAEEVSATNPVPAFDAAAIDGYAVRSVDVAAAPTSLPVVGDVAAGSPTPLRVQPGLCVRIAAGAPLPTGADTVVPTDWTDGGVASVRIERAPQAGAFVRRAAADVETGAPVLPVGAHVGAPQIALLASTGRSAVRVRPRPRVVVVATGAELVEVGQPTAVGQLVDANTYALTTAAREAGAIAYRVGVAPDDARRLRSALEDHLIRADVVLLTGNVSAGAASVVADVLSDLGRVTFSRVAMEPGPVQGFGVIGPDDTPIFGLPGSPVGALVAFEIFVRPALRRMLGAEPLMRPSARARLTKAAPASPEGRTYLPARVETRDGGLTATPLSDVPDRLSALAAANALVVLDGTPAATKSGTDVDVLLLERRSR